MNRNRSGRMPRDAKLVPAFIAAGLVLAACGTGGEGGDAGGADADCDTYPSEDISFIVPYAAGGGFDAWARLMAPYMEEYLPGDAAVRVENIDGGGGMRAMNQISAGEPDGTEIIFTEPGFGAVNQILGRTQGDFDIRELTYLSQTTVDPQVFAVGGDSDVTSIADLEGQSVKHAGQDISPIETIIYDTFGVEGEFILHDATSETFLALQRGDSDITVTSLSSILDYLEPGEVEPILFVGTEEINSDLLGYDKLEGTETVAEAGHPELAEVLEQYRVVAAPPGLPECVADVLSEAISSTLADEEFVENAEEANLRVIPASAEDTQERVSATYATFEEYSDSLERAIG